MFAISAAGLILFLLRERHAEHPLFAADNLSQSDIYLGKLYLYAVLPDSAADHISVSFLSGRRYDDVCLSFQAGHADGAGDDDVFFRQWAGIFLIKRYEAASRIRIVSHYFQLFRNRLFSIRGKICFT